MILLNDAKSDLGNVFLERLDRGFERVLAVLVDPLHEGVRPAGATRAQRVPRHDALRCRRRSDGGWRPVFGL
jgi:hypothetical protein